MNGECRGDGPGTGVYQEVQSFLVFLILYVPQTIVVSMNLGMFLVQCSCVNGPSH